MCASPLEAFAKIWLAASPATGPVTSDPPACFSEPTGAGEEIESDVFLDHASWSQYKEAEYGDEGDSDTDRCVLLAFNKNDTGTTYELPAGYAEFYARYPNGVSFKDPGVSFAKTPSHSDSDHFINPNGAAIDPWTHYTEEWINILADANSVDNGGGALLINCAPQSEHFGRLMFYSSNDEGSQYFTTFQFDDWIAIMIDQAPAIEKSFRDCLPDPSDMTAECSGSIVDYFCYNAGFDCDAYFATRSDVVSACLGPWLLAELATIVAEYGVYKKPVKWGRHQFADLVKSLGISADTQ